MPLTNDRTFGENTERDVCHPNITFRKNQFANNLSPFITLRKKTEITVIGKHIMYIILNEQTAATKLFHYLRTTRMFEEFSERNGLRQTRFYDIPMPVWYGITGLNKEKMLEILAGIDNVYVMGKGENCHIVILRCE